MNQAGLLIEYKTTKRAERIYYVCKLAVVVAVGVVVVVVAIYCYAFILLVT